ncbi:uncharacterized protein METZ01_LOCUS238466, partial [marine metagenome]
VPQVVSGWDEDIKDPALPILFVADEDAVPVPDTLRGQVDVPRPEDPALPCVTVAYPEVKASSDDNAQLLVFFVVVHERPL